MIKFEKTYRYIQSGDRNISPQQNIVTVSRIR